MPRILECMSKLSFILVELVAVFSLISIPFEIHKVKEASVILGYSIVVDPGHGGKDNGCSYGNVYEDDINLAIGKALFEELQKDGVMAYLTRDGDYDLADESAVNRKREDLIQRVGIIRSFQADILVSLHVNHYADDSIRGPMVYYRAGDDDSKNLAEKVQDELNAISGLNKITHGEDFYLFRKTECLALLVECGFISNVSDRENLLSENYRQLLAGGIVNGIGEYVGSQKKEKS